MTVGVFVGVEVSVGGVVGVADGGRVAVGCGGVFDAGGGDVLVAAALISELVGDAGAIVGSLFPQPATKTRKINPVMIRYPFFCNLRAPPRKLQKKLRTIPVMLIFKQFDIAILPDFCRPMTVGQCPIHLLINSFLER
jgi:hypothetical protein